MTACDVLLRDATVIDGSGAPGYRGDVAVTGGRIAAVAPAGARRFESRQALDLDGLVLAPGFIDVHSHDDRLLLADPVMTPKLSQAYPETMVGSDGLPHDAFPHPRLWGAFPRVLGHYARGRGLFTLETAVHKMTGLPADRFRLGGRGRIAADSAADLGAFDPARVADAATFAAPKTPATGIVSVRVNGTLAWHDGRATAARAGQVLRRAH